MTTNARPEITPEVASDSSDEHDDYPARLSIARWTLLGGGLAALAVFFLVPFLSAASLYRVVLQPGYGLSHQLDAGKLETMEVPLRNLLLAAEVERLHREVGEPVPLVASEDEPSVALTPLQTMEVGTHLRRVEPKGEQLRGELQVIGRYMQVASLCYLVVAILCLIMPFVPGLGAGSMATMITTGAAALVLLASHLLTIGFDLSGAAPEAAFSWQGHLATAVVVLAVGIGSALPLRASNALRCVAGTILAFLVAFVLVGAYLVL